MANKAATRIIAVIACVFTVIVLLLNMAQCPNTVSIDNEPDQTTVNYLYGTAGCLYLMDKNSITIDSEMKGKIKDMAENWFIENNYQSLGSSQLAKIICVDDYFQLGHSEKLMNELNLRYHKERKLFAETRHMDYGDNPTDDDKLRYDMQTTSTVCAVLGDMNIKNSEHDIVQMLADSFNENVDKYDINTTLNRRTLSSELENIFYYFLNKNSIERIDYQPVWKELERHYNNDIFESNKESSDFEEFSVNNLPSLYTDSQVVHELGAGFDLTYTPQKFYELLTTEDSFGISDDEAIYYLYTNLNQDPDLNLKTNSFFVQNINKWLANSIQTFSENS